VGVLKKKTPQAPGPRDNEVIIQRRSQHPSQNLYDGPPEQIFEFLEGDNADMPTGDAGSHSQSKVCANKSQHLIHLILWKTDPYGQVKGTPE